MTIHVCDICNKSESKLFKVPIYVHLKTGPMEGYIQINQGVVEPISGKIEDTEMCLSCYNEIMTPLWKTIKDKIENNDR